MKKDATCWKHLFSIGRCMPHSLWSLIYKRYQFFPSFRLVNPGYYKYPEVIFISVTRLFYFQTYISTFWRKCDVYRKSFSGKNIVGLGIDCIHGSVYNL